VQASISSLVFYNRDGGLACRLFMQNGCTGWTGDTTANMYNGANQGAIFGLSNTPLTTAMTDVPTTMCNSPSDTNCRCAFVTTSVTQHTPRSSGMWAWC
jgi:hypothetical protein